MRQFRVATVAALLLCTVVEPLCARARRPMTLQDFYSIKSVSEMSTSADGRWAVYVVREIDRDRDGRISSIWRVPITGGAPMLLTRSADNDRLPKFSPDGRHLAFLSNRNAEAWEIAKNRTDRGQLFLFSLDGGGPFPVTALPGGVSSYDWAPDGRRIVVVARDAKVEPERGPAGTPLPVVLTRLRHKAGTQYLDDRKQHLYLVKLDDALATSGMSRSEPRALTRGRFDEASPVWSPNGSKIAFSSNRTSEPDANRNTDIWTVDVTSLQVNRLTSDPGTDSRPTWSPDGSKIAYIHTSANPPLEYGLRRLMVIPANGGEPEDLTGKFDRDVSRLPNRGGFPRWSADGRSLYVTMIEKGLNPLFRVRLDGSRTLIVKGDIQQWDLTSECVVAIDIPPDAPADLFRVPLKDGDALRNLSRANEELFRSLAIRGAESTKWRSADGTSVHGWLIKPVDFEPGRRYPLVVWIHGGPGWHWTHAFRFEPHYFAARGYAVLLPNPRGSRGYGEAFALAVSGDWGNKDYRDVLSGVDSLIEQGLVSPGRLGVGGWSYGAVLTNYIVTKTDRFAAAVSGAGHSDLLSSFGTDAARLDWIEDFGLPWENLQEYRRLSPVTEVDKVTTPMLFLYGQRDFNCSPLQAEQMYVCLKTLGRETALILYPDEGHSIAKPSNLVDRVRRYGLWFDRYVRNKEVDPTYTVWPPAGQNRDTR